MIWFLSLILSVSVASAKGKKKRARPPAKVNLSKVDTCAPVENGKKVMVLKQWHLAPHTITKGFKEKYPQEKNQSAIYKTLADKVKAGTLDLLVAEGCEGEINAEFKPTFNGWDVPALRAQADRKEFPKIITNVALKVEAKYEEKILTMCGDDEKLIKEGNVRLSNLRGWTGYLNKLSNDEQGKPYAESAAALLKVSVTTPIPELREKIKTEIKTDLERLAKSLDDRNDAFVKVLKDQEYKEAAVVIGGLHAADLKSKIEAAGLNCEVFEPPGYARDSENLVRDFQGLLK